MYAAGFLGDVAADRAGDLAARVRRVVQAVRGGHADREVRYAGLDARDAGQRVDVEDPVELREDSRQASLVRQRAARQPRAAPRATTGTSMAGAGSQYALTWASVSGSATTIGSWRYAVSPSHS